MSGDDAHRVASVIEAVAECVESRYVDARRGALAAEVLRGRLRAGSYDTSTYGPELVSVVTADLHGIVPDLHLQVRWSDEPRAVSSTSDWDDPDFLAAYWAREALDNYGFDKVERLPGNVGLLVVRSIDEPEGTAGVIDAAFGFVARCSALIIDLRSTTGGAPSGVAYFLRHLLPPGTPLIESVDRHGAVTEQTAIPTGRGPTLEAWVPVFALTSRRTVSGCEELVYDLRAAERATLVGATTAGAANPVDVYAVDPHVVVRVPTALVRHARTGGNWEGVGVVPDVECAPEDALHVAHRLAVDAVRRGIADDRIHPGDALLEELADAASELDRLLGR